jgi:flagellar basal-body rod protein FlgB
MFESVEILKQAQAMAAHAGARQSAIARNIANADTPGYRPLDLAPFAESYQSSGDFAARQTRPGHLAGEGSAALSGAEAPRLIEGAASPNDNGVSLEAEMVKAADVRHQHDMALAIYQNALGILRASIGRGR